MTAGVSGIAAAAMGPGAAASAPMPSPRLVRAAHEFEVQMMKELLRPMTESGSLTGDVDECGGAGTLGEFASESLAGALSASGGLGIAGRILSEVSRSGNSSKNSSVIEKRNTDCAGIAGAHQGRADIREFIEQ
jgi:Rod binding domain-containing protein